MTQKPWLPYALVAPAAIFLALLFIYPLAQTIWLSVSGPEGFGLHNYRRMVGDLNFATALRNTLLLTAVVVPIQIAMAILMAVMVQKLDAGRDIVLWIWTIPLAVSDLAAGLAWYAILQNSGYLNSALQALGIIADKTNWLTYETPLTLFAAIAVAEIWRATAIVLIIIVAGLQLIPRDYAEAAEVFGATPWTQIGRAHV